MATTTIVNVTTGEVITRDLTDDEEAARLAANEVTEARRAEEEAADTKLAEDKASGDAKLKALGLTDDEIAAR